MTTDVHLLSGAYALHALVPDEVVQFEAHLVDCASCRVEVEEFRSVVASLADLEALTVPPRLRARVLQEAATQRQLPPLVDPAGPTRDAVPTHSADDAEHGGTVVRLSAFRRGGRALAAAAAALVLLGGVGYVAQAEFGQPSMSPSASQVFDSPDARTIDVPVGEGHLAVATSASSGRVAVDARDLPGLTAAQVYQLWAVRDGQATSMGVLDQASAALRIPQRGTVLAITVEPAGGSSQPTSAPIVQVDPTTA